MSKASYGYFNNINISAMSASRPNDIHISH